MELQTNLEHTKVSYKRSIQSQESGNLFRFMEDEDWICCCCSCGCSWFFDKEGNRTEDKCDKSTHIEKTDPDLCNLCAECIDVCAYDARSIENDKMIVETENCYGCSACEYICPTGAIEMIRRD